ncbi:MAG: amidohydrolase [Chloroflexi bacterium]|nr:amidohydrolase [Chloroflexota bacterium]
MVPSRPMTGSVDLAKRVTSAAQAVAPHVRALREQIHANPELRFQERKTAELCARELESLGLKVRRDVGRTGVVGVLHGTARNGSSKCVGLRAEMDALAMEDQCGRPYASRTQGIAHLCGHDVHVACHLGAAHVLSQVSDNIAGDVKFLFEPAEENTPPGDISGAEAMIGDGALENPGLTAIFGGHVYPDWPAGSIALRVGSSFSGNDRVRLTIIGKESHSAVPSAGVDAIVVAAHVITALQSFASRQLPVDEASSLHFGMIQGGRVSNLLAESVELSGTFRISDEALRDHLPKQFERLVKGVCDSFGARYELEYASRSLPAVVSTQHEVEIMSAAAVEVLGRQNVIPMRNPRLAADTFHNWLKHVPGVFYMVGTSTADPATRWPSHHQRFDVAPETYPAFVAAVAMTAIRYLERA